MKTEQWIANFNTVNTRDAAKKSLIAWNKYLVDQKINETTLIKKIILDGADLRYDELANFVNEYSNVSPVQPASIRQYYHFIRSYFRAVHGIKTYTEDAKIFIKPPSIVKVSRMPLTREKIKVLCQNADLVHKASYLVLASSGMRMSEFLSCTPENYNFKSDPIMVSISGKKTKTKTERITFISHEASAAIRKAGREFWLQRSLLNEESAFSRVRKRAGFIEKYTDSVNYYVNLHSFRAFFRTNAGKINQDFAESLLGHGGYLTQYVRLSPEELGSNYRKLEPKLRIWE